MHVELRVLSTSNRIIYPTGFTLLYCFISYNCLNTAVTQYEYNSISSNDTLKINLLTINYTRKAKIKFLKSNFFAVIFLYK